jgi:transcriptional regulator with XRE-family HTH domain
MATGWWSYVERIGNYAQQKDIAERAGIDAAALSRWKTELTRRPRAEHVVKFARAYNRPPTEALVAAGFITKDEAADTIEVHHGPDALADAELLAELARRLDARQAGGGDRRHAAEQVMRAANEIADGALTDEEHEAERRNRADIFWPEPQTSALMQVADQFFAEHPEYRDQFELVARKPDHPKPD